MTNWSSEIAGEMCYEVAKQVEIDTISKDAKLCWQNVNRRKEYSQYHSRLENCQKEQRKKYI